MQSWVFVLLKAALINVALKTLPSLCSMMASPIATSLVTPLCLDPKVGFSMGDERSKRFVEKESWCWTLAAVLIAEKDNCIPVEKPMYIHPCTYLQPLLLDIWPPWTSILFFSSDLMGSYMQAG